MEDQATELDLMGIMKFIISNQQTLEDSIEGKISRLHLKLDRIYDELAHEVRDIRNEFQEIISNSNNRLSDLEEKVNLLHHEYQDYLSQTLTEISSSKSFLTSTLENEDQNETLTKISSSNSFHAAVTNEEFDLLSSATECEYSDLSEDVNRLNEIVADLEKQVSTYASQHDMVRSELLSEVKMAPSISTKVRNVAKIAWCGFSRRAGRKCFYCGHFGHRERSCRFIKRDRLAYIKTLKGHTIQATDSCETSKTEKCMNNANNETGIFKANFLGIKFYR